MPSNKALILSCFVFLCLIYTPLQSQDKDTLSVSLRDPITKNASKPIKELHGLSVESIDLSNINENRIESALQRSSGLFINTYGGKGGVSTLSIRGASSSSTLVLMNGMQLSSTQNGLVDLSLLPPILLNSAEVKKSGASVEYGSNAMSGVLNLEMSSYKSSEFGLSYGTYDDIGALSRVKVNDDFSIGVSYESFSGRYPYIYLDEHYQRNNAGFSRFNLMANTVIDSNNSLSLWLHSSDRGIPGPHIYRRPEKHEDSLEDDIVFLSYKGNYGLSLLGSEGLRVGSSVKYQESDVRSTILGRLEQFNYKNYQSQLRGELNWNSKNTLISLINEYSISFLDGDNLDPSAGKRVSRIWGGLSGSIYKRYGDADEGVGLFELAASARGDYFNDYGLQGSGLLNLSYHIMDGMIIATEPSYNYRMPSFNELYYLNYGNQDLMPEKSITIPLDIDYNEEITSNSLFKARVSGFVNYYEDMILSIPTSPVIFSAHNIGESRVVGFEASGKLMSSDWEVSISYLRQEAEEKRQNLYLDLPNVPKEVFTAWLGYDNGKLLSNLSFRHTSFRYRNRGENPNTILPAFQLLDLRIGYKLHVTDSDIIESLFFVDNLMNQNYQVIANYPMPGRLYGLRINYLLQ